MTPSAPLFNTELTKEFVPTLGVLPSQTCPNEFPKYETQHKIAIVGEAPGTKEIEQGKPFIGGSGNLLFGALGRYGINRADCFIGNVRQSPMPDKIKGPLLLSEVQDGIRILTSEIVQHKPNIVLLAGNLALAAAFPSTKRSITDWRGSILVGAKDGFCPDIKCIPCIHPAAVFRDWSQWPLFTFDIERFAHESTTATCNLPVRQFNTDVSAGRAIELLNSITGIPDPVALDIEGGVSGVSCISFARSPHEAFIVALALYSDVDKRKVLRALHNFLRSSTPKVLQNQLYDNFVLSWTYKMPIRNVVWDTMLSGWEIYPELPKGLGTQVSIWTREPFYKMDRKSEDARKLHEYCCKDSACTYEMYENHKRYLQSKEASQRHFRFNMSLLPALLYMEQRGINYDKVSAGLALTEAGVAMHKLQQAIDLHIQSKWQEHGSRGEIPKSVNINSPKQLADLLFLKLGYPKQHPKVGRELDRTRVTTNVDALLELRKHYNGDEHLILEHILQWRKQDGLRETLELTTDKDGRMRCGYNIVGTETGRLTCYGSPTGSGANLTTITKSLRRLYVADADHWFFQCDLSGADGWTVAAHCALRGDTTMLDDYRAGLKPAKIIALMMQYGKQVNTWSRERLLLESKAITEDGPLGWQYFACKRVQHGTNYGLGKDKMAIQVLKDSYKLLGRTYVISPGECVIIQDYYLSRYPGVRMWQRACQQQIDTTQTMQCASGHERRFFGRRGDHSTYMEAYAHEPQANTTYATNFALWRLWTDEQNRKSKIPTTNESGFLSQRNHVAPLRIEPLHHVHDALCGQFRKEDLDWARPRIREYFNNTLTIAGREIVIPFDGAFGSSWGQLGKDYGGGKI